jgi:dienelactone hydrolase
MRRLPPTVAAILFALLTASGLGGCVGHVQFANAHPGGARSQLTIPGTITKPEGDGPFPALVLLHGCSGIDSHHKDWATALAHEGYVTVLVDSHGPRHMAESCTGASAAGDRIWDALGALRHLRSLPYVAGHRIGVMGWSEGGAVALRASSDRLADHVLKEPGFRATIAFYPGCGGNLSTDTTAAVLLLLGEKDDWTSPIPCVQIATELQQASRPVEYVVYPNTTHGFDQSWMRGDVTYLGHLMRYDPVATGDALTRIRSFLQRHLGPA